MALAKGPIRVLIVDDSPLAREALKSILGADPDIEVTGEAADGYEGVKKAVLLKPDVITMDLNMPAMGGLEAIEKIMEEVPTPIIVVSGMHIDLIVKALTIGAMDFVAVTQEIDTIAEDLRRKIKIASKVKALRHIKIAPAPRIACGMPRAVDKVIAIGISTGGPQALQIVLSHLPCDFPAGIVIVQHMSKGFMDGLVEWLRYTSRLDIQVAKSGMVLKSGMALFAPDNTHLHVDPHGSVVLKDDPARTHFHIPAIDETMQSVAAAYGPESIGVIMTGMGQDGVEGIGAIRKAGGMTIAQDEHTSVVYGMNKMAVERGHIHRIVPLEKIADEIIMAVG